MIILLVLFSCIKEFGKFKLVHKGKDELIEAIRMGKEINEIVPLINSPEDINEVDVNNKSALGVALSNRNRGIVEILLSQGGDISKVKKEDLFEFINKTKKDKNRGSLLHFMILNNMEEKAVSFLDKIIELDLKENERDEILKQEDEKGKEAIYLALDREMYELIRQILRLYSKEERKRRLGFKSGASTLFLEALKKKNVKSIFLILNLKKEYKDEEEEKENDIDTKYENKIVGAFESIYELVEEGMEDNFLEEESIFLSFLKECLKKKGKREKINVEEFLSKIDKKKKKEVFLLGLILGEKKVVNYLLEGNEIDVNIDIQDGRTPLYVTSRFGNKEVVQLLIEKGASIDASCKDGYTPLHVAIVNGHKEVVEILIEKGASIDVADKNGYTPLHVASHQGLKEVVELLIEKGAEIDKAEKILGSTALIIASKKGHKEVVELLIEKGAEIDKAEKILGSTALIIASQKEHKEVVELLIEKGAEIDKAEKILGSTALYVASQNGHREIVKLLTEKGASIDVANKDGYTPLHIASQQGHTEVVKLLIEKGAEIDKTEKILGSTALIIASQKGHKELVELLIEKGASIDTADKDGYTPLHVASVNGHTAVVEILIEKGVEIDKTEKILGLTALHAASQQCNKEVVELLIEKAASIDAADKDGYTPSYVASLNGHKEVVEILIEKGAAIDLATNNGFTLLHGASHQGRKEVIELLIEKGASIDVANKDGYTPLHVASHQGLKEVIELLIEKGASIDAANKNGYTPLHVASQKGHREIVKVLIEKGAAIDLATNNGYTPLHLASANGHTAVVEILMEKGALIDAADKDGHMPLYLASHQGYIEVVEILIEKGASIDAANKDGYKPLYLASANGHKEVVEILIKKGASIDAANKDGYTPLHVASQQGNKEVVELLIEKAASIDAADKDGYTPLYVASQQGNKELVAILIEKGATIDLADKYGSTPLYIASWKGHKEVVEILIEKGASIDAANKDGYTPLYVASHEGHTAVVEILIEKGASIDSAYKDGHTPLYIASQRGNKEVVKLLIEKGAKIDLVTYFKSTPLQEASRNGHKEIVELLIEKGVEIDLADQEGRTPLYKATCTLKKEVVELLLSKGANINLENKNGLTPLLLASQEGNKTALELLIEKGADINLENKNGLTPLLWASQEGKKEVLELLIEKGADINLVNKYGSTPLYTASARGHKEILACLICKGATIPKNIVNDRKYSRSKIIKQMIEYFKEKGLKDSSWCFTSSILLEKKHFPIIQDLANQIPLSFLEDNFFSIPDLNYYGYNSLHFCMFQNNTNSLKALLLDSNIRELVNSYDNKEKESCLGLAVRLNKLEHIKVLLSHCASPIYRKYTLLASTLLASIPRRFNVLEEIIEIREYVSSKIIFDVLKEGRTEDGAKLLFGHAKVEKKIVKGKKEENVLADLDTEINNFSYKDIINLKAFDSEDKNVFHYLAIYGRGIDVSEFLIRSLSKLPNMEYEIPSFSEELLFAYDKFGYTPFHYALLNSNEDFVEAFLTNERIKKEDINKVTQDGRSIFDLIEEFVSKEVVTLLIKYLWSKEDIKFLYESAKVKEEDKEIYLLIKESKEEGAFKVKVKIDNVETVEEESTSADAIEAFENLHLDDSNILRAMSLAYIFNAGKCLEIVLSKMTEQETKMRVTLDLMLKACRENKEEILSILIGTNKEKLIIQDKDGNTLLHQACIEGKIGIVRKLLKHEIVRKNIDIQNKLGNTAMHNAHIALSPSIVIELKEAGADIGIRNKASEEGKRGIDLLKDRNIGQNEELIRLGTMYASLCCILGEEYDADYERILHLAIEAGEYWIVNDLSTHGYINLQDKDGNTPLHLAVKQDKREVVDTLMKNGSNFFIMNNKKETAISLIRSKETCMRVIQNAIENKGITSRYILGMSNKEGSTLLHLVAERIKRGEIENISAKGLIRAILDNGGKKETINRRGERAINILEGNEELVIFLKGYEPNHDEMKRREEHCYEKRRLKYEENKRNQEEEREVIEVLNGERDHDRNLSSGRRAIHLVVERNDEFALIELLKKGSDPNCEDGQGRNCYEIGIANNSIDAFKILIKRELIDDLLVNGNIFEEIRGHASPLYLGVEEGGIFFDAVFKRLKEECENGYKIHKLRELKHNPIDKIVELSKLDMMEKLVELGLKIEDREKESPLVNRLISRNNVLKIIEDDSSDMLDKLTKIGFKLDNIKELIFKALSKSKIKVFKYLLNKLPTDGTRKEFLKNWQDIIMMHDPRTENEFIKDAYRLLLETEDIFEESVNGISAIHLGIIFRNDLFEIIFEKLKESKDKIDWAKIRENKVDLNDPIKELINKDDVDILSRLIEQLGLEIVDKYGHNLLIEAIQVKSKKIFEYLVPKIDKQETIINKFRYESSALEIAQLRNGAKSEVKDNYYLSLLSKRLEELDEEEREKVNEELKEVLEGNININAKLSNRQPALHTVIRFFEVSKVIIERLEGEKRSKERVQDPSLVETESALVEENRKKDELKEKIKVLIEKQADPSLEDKYENNCYELANDEEIFEMLIKGKDIYEEKAKESGKEKHGSIIFLSVQKGLKVFETVFKRLEEEYLSKNLDITKLRDLEYDPVSEIIKTYNLEMLKRLMSIGQRIVDKNRNNILTEAIVQKQRIIFDHLIEELRPGSLEFPNVRDVKIIRDVISKEYRVKINGEWRDRTAETEARIINSSDSYYHEGINRKLKILSIMIEK